VERRLYSPFDPKETTGILRIEVDTAVLQASARGR
jgi:hypothetical protein